MFSAYTWVTNFDGSTKFLLDEGCRLIHGSVYTQVYTVFGKKKLFNCFFDAFIVTAIWC